MNKILFIAFTLVFALSSCSSNPQNSSNEVIKGKTIALKGRVFEIQRGKDGYTAKIKSDDDKVHSATISSVELGSRYREVKIGEIIEVEGEDTLGDGQMIRVTVLR